jgi:hypothetical protein
MVELENIEVSKKEIIINIRNHDLLNETPILDIKPVVSTDLPTADPNFGWQKTEWNTLEVTFSADIKASKKIKEIVTDILRQDPRPAYDKTRENNKIYKMSFDNLNINFTVNSSICTVLKIFE